MKYNDLNCIPESNGGLRIAIDAIQYPDLYLEKLCQVAKRDQWDSDNLDWEAIRFQHVPSTLRQNVAQLFAQLHYGEIAAYVGAAKFAQSSPRLSEQLFSTQHVADEARHVSWFAQLMQKLDCETQIEDSVAHLIHEILHAETEEAFVLGLHIFIEGMAHSYFMEGTRAFSSGNWLKSCSQTYRSAKTVFAQWLPYYLGKDEGRHIAFGVYYLKKQMADMGKQRRDLLERQTEHWISLFQSVLVDPKINVVPGLDGKAMRLRCVNELNRLLEKVGLEQRIAQL